MDFDDKPDEASFRAEVRKFLEQRAPRKRESTARLSQGAPDAEMVRRAREWQAIKADHGFASIQLPKRWGGREGKPTAMMNAGDCGMELASSGTASQLLKTLSPDNVGIAMMPYEPSLRAKPRVTKR